MSETRAPFSISGDRRLTIPMQMLVWAFGIMAAGIMAWATVRSNVSDNSTRIGDNSTRIGAVETEQRAQREILIRIDERTAEMKRQLDHAAAR